MMGRPGGMAGGGHGGTPPRFTKPQAVQRTFPYLRNSWAWIAGALAGLVGVSAATLISPQLIRIAVDRGISQSDAAAVMAATIGLVLIAAARGGFTFLQGYGMESASQGLAFELRDAIFSHIQRLSFSFYDKVEASQLMTRITSDVEQVRLFVSTGLLQAVSGLLLLAGTLTILFSTNWRLALLAILPIPVVLVFFGQFMKNGAPIFGRLQAKAAALNGVLSENIAGLRVVRAFVRESAEVERFERISASLYDDGMITARMISTNFPTVFTVGSLSSVLVLWVGGLQVIDGTLTVGELLSFMNYLAFLLFPILSLGFLAFGLARAEASAVRIFEVLDAPIDVADRPGAVPLGELQGEIRFEAVSLRYPGDARQVLEDISFVVEPGQTVAILGATGSGKSSIVNLIPRFYDVSAGRVLVDGHDVRDVELASLRSQIGIVLQDSRLVRGSIRENIAFGLPDANLERIRQAAEDAQAAEFIDKLPNGYDTLIGDRGVGLSGGQRQRLAIARALLVRPKILVLDDSTSAVDATTEAKIQDALDLLIRDRQSTVLVIAQRISTVRDADLILLLDQGKLAAQGTHEDLLANSPLYNDILGSQLRADAKDQAAAQVNGSRSPAEVPTRTDGPQTTASVGGELP